MRRYTARGAVDGGPPQDFERAVRVLLSEPARPLLGDIRHCLSQDSEYLFYHKLTVGVQIDTLLKDNGIQWPSTVFEDYGFRALHVALESSRINKKGSR
jgi:hypothetical protein